VTIRQISPLSQALHRVDDVAAKWFRILNDERWIGLGGYISSLSVKLFKASHRVPVKLYLKGDGAQILIVLDETQWPALGVANQFDDIQKRDVIINILSQPVLQKFCEIGIQVDTCYSAISAQPKPESRISVSINGYLVDLHPEHTADGFFVGMRSLLAKIGTPISTRISRWLLPTFLKLDERTFLLSHLEALKVGDLIFLRAVDYLQIRVFACYEERTSDLVAKCQVNKRELKMEEALHRAETVLASDELVQSLPLNEKKEILHSDYSGLRVRVKFEVDGPAMTIGEAVALVAGEVIELQDHIDNTRVYLRCQGRCFATGELVNVGGQLGVRIIETGDKNV